MTLRFLASKINTINQTIAKMSDIIRRYSSDPKIIMLSRAITKSCRSRDALCEARRIFKFVKKRVRYVYDPPGTEFLQDPVSFLGLSDDKKLNKIRSGDCDDFSIAIGALLRSIGHNPQLVIVRDYGMSGYHHVFVRDPLDTGAVILDAIRDDTGFNSLPRNEFKNIKIFDI